MSSFSFDENGVPILSTDAIELKAEEVISYFDRTILEQPQRTPMLNFIEELHKKFDLFRDYSSALGRTKYGSIILGKTKLNPLGIYVDKSLANDARFNFVLGHEFGHVVLHRSVDLKGTGYEQQEIVDTEIDLVTGKKNFKTPRDWLEWQANRFSSAILMPRLSMFVAVIAKQKKMGITRDKGTIFLEEQPYSKRDYQEITNHLGLVYNVNATNVECRLKDLGILIDHRDINVKHISEMFATE
ncbi:MAG TPA: ImmA/IrrE family metallo-endopeptidase [Planctomycetes bacterium]|nr:ImmA/IrrE family metallo-endopeptidase [Planctomycetota bacterium]